MQESQLLWVGPVLPVIRDPFWFDLAHGLYPGPTEAQPALGSGARLGA